MRRIGRRGHENRGVTTAPTAIGSIPDGILNADQYARLARRIESARGTARARGSSVIAGITVELAGDVDPVAVICAARNQEEFWACIERPEHGHQALAGLGVAARVVAAGVDRFNLVSRECADALAGAEIDDLADDPKAPPGSGVTWLGGFAFLDDGAWSDCWRERPPAEFVLPSVSIARGESDGVRARLTLNVLVEPGDQTSTLLVAAEHLVGRLSQKMVADSQTAGNSVRDHGHEVGRRGGDDAADNDDDAIVAGSAPPEHYEQAVAQAVSAIRAGELEKIVLAREVVLRRGRAIDAARALMALRERFPECACFAIGSGETTFIGASPELLVRREGRRVSTMALAGSIRRGTDPAMDRHLGNKLLDSEKDNREHAIVVRRIERTLGRLSAWVAAAERPELVRVKNVQHLATPIRAQLTQPRPAIELAGLLHPTPAVGGEPWPKAAASIRSLEGFDRGWYTGAVGWTDQLEDGEFHVALRCALIEGDQARLFVGAGIVADSDPATELAETETKLDALLPILAVI